MDTYHLCFLRVPLLFCLPTHRDQIFFKTAFLSKTIKGKGFSDVRIKGGPIQQQIGYDAVHLHIFSHAQLNLMKVHFSQVAFHHPGSIKAPELF